jgi:hypothetical protein
MTTPTARHPPASASPPSTQQAQAQAHRQAYHRRKTRAKVQREARQQREAAQVEALSVSICCPALLTPSPEAAIIAGNEGDHAGPARH